MRAHGVFIYARYSTDNQQADSIEVQVERCQEYCQRNGLSVLDVFPDYAVSGMKASRKQYDRMLEELGRGNADIVLVYDQSRLFRDMGLWFNARAELSAMGVDVRSVTQPFVGGDIQDPTTFIMEASNAMINQMWVLQTRQKTVAKMRWMAENGIHTGGVPALGYRVENGRLAIDEAEAEIVRRIFREYYEGKSLTEITAGLNRDGITTKRGSKWGKNSLHDLLKNPKYIGTIVYGEKVYRADGTRNTSKPEGKDIIRIENAIPAIITKELFQAVQDKMEQNRHKNKGGRPPYAREYPLRGKVFCGECGSAMSIAANYGNNHTYYYYRCARRDRNKTCTNRPVRADILEKTVVDYVRALMGAPDIQQEALALIRAHADRINATAVSQYNAESAELRRIDNNINNIISAIASGAYSKALNNRLQTLEQEKATTELRMRNLRHSAEVAALPAERMEALLKKICTSAKTDAASICAIVSRVEVYAEEIKIYTAFDPDPDPGNNKQARKTAYGAEEMLVQTAGTPSGVPTVFINAIGLGIIIARNKMSCS